MDLLAFVSGIRTALYQCGQIAKGLRGHVTQEHKLPDSVHQTSTGVSVVDRLCQETVLLAAHAILPDIEVHSEELDDCPAEILDLSTGNHHRYALILDPLDGTQDYLSGLPTYGHMLGLLDQESGRMACGLVYLPESGEMMIGIRGMGTYRSTGLSSRLHALPVPAPVRTVGDTKRLLRTDYESIGWAGFTLAPAVSRSAAVELMRVARGEIGAEIMRHFHGHDHAMASVILEELGGAALDEAGKSVTYTRDMPRQAMVVLSASATYAGELAAVLGSARREAVGGRFARANQGSRG